jgi:hypothetical protein
MVNVLGLMFKIMRNTVKPLLSTMGSPIKAVSALTSGYDIKGNQATLLSNFKVKIEMLISDKLKGVSVTT